MKILHVADNFNAISGHCMNIFPKMLKHRGHDVSIISSTKSVKFFRRGDENYPVKIKRIKGFIISNRNIFPGLIPHLLLQKNPDMIHGYVYGHFSTFVLACLKKIKGYKLVVEADFNEMEKKPSLLKSIYIYFYRKFPAKMTDVITTFTSRQREELSKRWGISKRKIKVLPIGIDYKRFSAKPKVDLKNKLKIGGKFVVLNVSRILPQKNIELFLNIAKSVNNKNLVFIHIGHVVDNKYKKNIDKIIKSGKLENGVIFIDHVPDQMLPEYYKMADMYLQTSYAESFGISLIEAMASGLPVITTYVGVAKDVIKNGVTGFIVKNGIEAKDSIELLIKNKTLMEKIGKNARNKAKEYDWEVIVDRLEKIYGELV